MQDAVKLSQPGGPGRFEMPNWDSGESEKVRDALIVQAATVPDTRRMFGARDQVDAVRHLIGTATDWGGNPEKDALYVTVLPSKTNGSTINRLNARDVPVDGFWSISVYNAEGYLQKNPYAAYTLNNITP